MLGKIELPWKNSMELTNAIARGETATPESYSDGILNDYFEMQWRWLLKDGLDHNSETYGIFFDETRNMLAIRFFMTEVEKSDLCMYYVLGCCLAS